MKKHVSRNFVVPDAQSKGYFTRTQLWMISNFFWLTTRESTFVSSHAMDMSVYMRALFCRHTIFSRKVPLHWLIGKQGTVAGTDQLK
ncbi:conserved hypothetical protein [Ricinus communis]|uniref:Uncharacterized protein n=1 Tax=Ricinus communis TaxID=3988 RepID=B9SMQ8_RICCO|nr:conserved hypothetical protein [Ricinus communis]